MKRKTLIWIFAVLVLITAVYTAVAAFCTYREETQQYDILEGLGAGVLLAVGGLVILYECDLFCCVYYFLFKPKTKGKTVLTLLADLCLFLVPLAAAGRWGWEYLPLALLAAWAVFRIAYFLLPPRGSRSTAG